MNWPLVPSLTSSSHPLSWVKHHLPVAHTDLCLPRNGKYWMGFACTPGSLSPAGVSPQTSVQPAFNWNRPMMHKGQPCSLMLLFPQSPRPLMPKKQSCPPRPSPGPRIQTANANEASMLPQSSHDSLIFSGKLFGVSQGSHVCQRATHSSETILP